MQNAECKIQKGLGPLTPFLDFSFCILHSAFFLSLFS
jgi:hypothetical protein